MAVLATGFAFPKAFAAASSDSVYAIVQDLQAKVNSSVFGLQIIQINVNTKASQTSVNNLQTTANSIKTDTQKVDATVSSRASQASVNALQTSVSGLNLSNLDAKVSTRATQTSVDNLHADVSSLKTSVSALGSGGNAGSGPNCVIIDGNKNGQIDRYEISPAPHTGVNYSSCYIGNADFNGLNFVGANLSGTYLSGADLSFANLSGANLSNADLRGGGGKPNYGVCSRLDGTGVRSEPLWSEL